MSAPVFVTGGTGYVGRPLIAALIARGHVVHALVRPESKRASVRSGGRDGRCSRGVDICVSDSTGGDSGAPRRHAAPDPAKAASFNAWTFARFGRLSQPPRGPGSGILCTSALSHPAPVMRAYIGSATGGEPRVRATGIPATILRTGYVLGPVLLPYVLVPAYAVLGGCHRREPVRTTGLDHTSVHGRRARERRRSISNDRRENHGGPGYSWGCPT